jgi:hypothetical protein
LDYDEQCRQWKRQPQSTSTSTKEEFVESNCYPSNHQEILKENVKQQSIVEQTSTATCIIASTPEKCTHSLETGSTRSLETKQSHSLEEDEEYQSKKQKTQ